MSYERYSPSGFGFLPPVVKNLIIINVLFFLATIFAGRLMHIDLTDLLGLHYFAAQKFAPYQFITYMFMHGGFQHIFFNMFALWMFGSVLEQVWGPKKFLFYYIFTGIGAALVHYIVFYYQVSPVINNIDAFISKPNIETLKGFISIVQPNLQDGSGVFSPAFESFKHSLLTLQIDPGNIQAIQESVNFATQYREYFLDLPVVVGASGAIFGLLFAFGYLFPNVELMLLFIPIPIKAKYFVIGYGALELYLGLTGSDSNVAHFAHLGGMIFGLILILLWRKKSNLHKNNFY